MKIRIKKGQVLLELVLTIALAALLIPTLMISLMASRDNKVRAQQQSQATSILKETEEAVRAVQKSGWSNLPASGNYYPKISANTWTLIAGASTSAGFTRQVAISDVRRATDSGSFVTSGGYVDPSTKKFTITISWTQPFNSSINSSFYLTRSDDASHTGGLSEFTLGNFNQTQATSSAGGEVILGNNTKGRWCSPKFSPATIDLPDGPPVAVAASTAATTAIPNDIFVATAPYATSSVKLAYVNTTANTASPAASLRGIFTLDPNQYTNPAASQSGIGFDNSFKTNDVKYYKSPGGKTYALLATTLPDREIIAIQVNDGTGDSYQDIPKKIYKYWTYFNTKIYPNATVTQNLDTGFLNPSNNAADTGGDGNGFQLNPTNAYADDAGSTVYAEDRDSGNDVGTTCASAGKDRHRYYDYNISVPAGATILGIETHLDAWVSSTTGSPDPTMCAQLSWDGGTTWTTAKQTSSLTTSQTTKTLGGAADTWGHTWDINNGDLTNSKFRLRITDVSFDNTRDFFLDWASVKVYYSVTSASNDQSPYGYGATAMKIFENKGYILSGGFLYTFDLSNIDSKSPNSPLDQIGCRVQVQGWDCQPGPQAYQSTYTKYNNGETNNNYSNTGINGTLAAPRGNCSDGGNIALNADEAIDVARVANDSNNLYAFIAIGYQAGDELDVIKVQNPPADLTSATCGVSDGNDWEEKGHLDFNPNGSSQEAANSVYAKSDGSKVFMTSNGGVDSNQFYVINTSTPSLPKFLTTSGTGLPLSGFYNGAAPAPAGDAELYPKRSLTVLNGLRAILVGKDGVSNGNNAEEYQVLNLDPQDGNSESAPKYCGGLDFNQGFNDLTSVSEADGDNFVYMIANTTSNELKIIQGGLDGSYLDQGDYSSPSIDLGYSTIFRSFSANINKPANTSMDFQFAIASPSAGQDCSNTTYSFTGPGGDTTQHYATNSALWVGTNGAYKNPGRCLKYRTFLNTTNYNNTPELKSMQINYAP